MDFLKDLFNIDVGLEEESVDQVQTIMDKTVMNILLVGVILVILAFSVPLILKKIK